MRVGALRSVFAPQIDEVDRRLTEYLDGFGQTPSHYDMIRYHLGVESERLARGKRLRAIFCLLIGRAAGSNEEAIKTLMLAIELAHSASLVHDDIQDGEQTRWDRPTVWARYGSAQAINVGDSMIAMVYQVLLSLADAGISHSRAIRIMQLFNRAHLLMAEGQHLDMRYEGKLDIGVDEYLGVISKKTAATCECSAHAAAICAGLDANEDAFRRFGQAFGMLYQVVDDITDIWSDPRDTGKVALRDLAMRKATLPFLYGYELGSPWLREYLGSPPQPRDEVDEDDAEYVRAELEALGIDDICRQYAADYRDEALAALGAACETRSPELEALEQMTELCARRAGIGGEVS